NPSLAVLATAQEQVPWPRPHPRRITSIEAIRYLRSLVLAEPIGYLLASELKEGGPNYWREVLATTGGQHIIRGLAILSLWWQCFKGNLEDFDIASWLK